MNNKFILPFALTGLVSALAACGGGGESATIFEDPNKGIQTTSNGCLESAEKCLAFYVDYPVEGLNFDCSSDKTNHFVTEIDSSVASGGCQIGDKVSFYIQGSKSGRKIVLGTVDLSKIRPLKISGQPAPIGLIDIATAMTGKAPTEMSMRDDTFKVMVGLVRILQTVSIDQDVNVEGDIQQINLSTDLKNNLDKVTANVDVKNFLDGRYISLLQPWINIKATSEASAQKVAEQLINLSNVNLYTANFLAVKAENVDVAGFQGKSSSSSGNESIANLYLLTTRQGYTTGYAVQWTGKPATENKDGQIISTIGRVNLLIQSAPKKLDGLSQNGWMNVFNKKISTPFVLNSSGSQTDKMELYQGTVFNGTNVPGTNYVYQRTIGDKDAQADKSVLGAWRQTLNNEQFTGSIDIYKTNPATYLDKQVFRSINTVKSGEKYIFPLYANLTFNFTDTTVPKVTLGVVIDENGDIRTNIGPNQEKTANMASDQCTNVDPVTMKDKTTGAQQYRIGTTGAANYSASDKSLTIRMILAGQAFGDIDGALVGLNESLVFLPQDGNGNTTSYKSGGVRLNLQNLIVEGTPARGINITGWNGAAATPASWGNMLAMSQVVFNSSTGNKDKVTPEQKELVKRSGGYLTIDLPKCYTVNTK